MAGPRKLPLPKRLDPTVPARGTQPTFVLEQRGIPLSEQPVRRVPTDSGRGMAVVVAPETGRLERDPRFPEEAGIRSRTGPDSPEQRLVQLLMGPNRGQILQQFAENVGLASPPSRRPDPRTAPRSIPVPAADPTEQPYSDQENLLRILRAVRMGQITPNEAVEFANNMPEGTDLDRFLMELRRLRGER